MRSGFAAEGKGVRASRYSRSCQLSFCPCLLGFFFPFLHTHSPRLTFPNPRFANKTSFAVRDLRLSADFPPVLPSSHAARGKHRQDKGWKTPDLRGVVSWRAKDFSLRHSKVDSYTKEFPSCLFLLLELLSLIPSAGWCFCRIEDSQCNNGKESLGK